MSEPVFLRRSEGLTLDEIAAVAGAVAPAAAHGPRIAGIAPLDRASRVWRRTYFVVVVYFVLGLALQLKAVPVSFAGVGL